MDKIFYNDRRESNNISVEGDNRFQKLSDTGIINVGITTGNNKYFSVNQEIVDTFELADVARPLIGRSSHAHSVYFCRDDWEKKMSYKEKLLILLTFPISLLKNILKDKRDYIALGERNKRE